MRLALLLCLAACGGGQARPDYGVTENSDDPAAGGRLIDPRREMAAQQPVARPIAGGLSRQSLDATLAEGPGAFLGKIRVRAVGDKGVFRGWVIVSLWPDARTELRPGDIVRRLNGRTLERPDDASALWDSLRQAHEIVVDYERDGEARVYRVPIVE